MKEEQWQKLAECGDQFLGGWQPNAVAHANNSEALDKAEDIWNDWRGKISAAAEAGLGYRAHKK